ncbi:fimbrial protein [Serratia fonticola]|uniref:fimbrial protein n=1 Tax=Serratia fonticola TaxID=47917 RepID=UPI003AAEDC1B
MNKFEVVPVFKKSLLALVLAAVTGSAFAAPVANLKVNGTITPPTCTINGDEDETEVLYTFDVSPGLFPASGNLAMAAVAKPIEVVCDASTYLAFTASDERADSALTVAATNFGLGNYGTDKVGFYTITMQNAKVKANPTATATNVGVLTGTAYATTGAINKTSTYSWGTAASTYSNGQVFSADFAVKPTLNGVLKNSDGTAELDGHAVLTFAFGV